MSRLSIIVMLLMLLGISDSVVAQRLRERRGKTFTHIVNQGETFYSIISRYGVDMETVLSDNPELNPEMLSPGQQIVMRRRQRGKSSQSDINAQWQRFISSKQKAVVIEPEYYYHRVKSGETLYSISRLYSVSIDSLVARNTSHLAGGLKSGDSLRIALASEIKAVEPEAVVTEDGNSKVVTVYRQIDQSEPLKVAMLLPINTSHGVQGQFVDFYRGALLALSDLKGKGVSVNLSLHNTSNSAETVNEIVNSGTLDSTNLIIGPVYAEPFGVVANYATHIGVPVVSPLAVVEGVDNPCVFQAPVSGGDKYKDIQYLLSESNNVIVISMPNGGADDKGLYNDIKPLLPNNVQHIEYNKELPVTVFEEILSDKTENVFVVLSTSELVVDEILARISSVQNNLVARSIKNASISVIGSSRWLRFQNIDRMLYFKLNFHCITSYHADRGNESVRKFDNAYLKEYNTLPSLYAYRGYDVTKLFVYAISRYQDRFVDHINDLDVELLQTPYHFVRTENGGMANQAWILVNYRRNFTISVNKME